MTEVLLGLAATTMVALLFAIRRLVDLRQQVARQSQVERALTEDLDPSQAFLQKPYMPAALTTAVRSLIDQS